MREKNQIQSFLDVLHLPTLNPVEELAGRFAQGAEKEEKPDPGRLVEPGMSMPLPPAGIERRVELEIRLFFAKAQKEREAACKPLPSPERPKP